MIDDKLNTQPPVEAVVFDYGGVLSPGGRAGTLINYVAQNADIGAEAVDPYVLELHDVYRRGQIRTADFFAELTNLYPDSPALTKESYIGRAQYVHERADEVYDLAEHLALNGIKTAILSNVYCISAKRLRAQGHYEGFDPVLLSCDEGLAKPDVEFFELAVERLGIEPNKIVFVDDQEKNFPPATSLGMDVVRSDSPAQVVVDLGKILLARNGLSLAA